MDISADSLISAAEEDGCTNYSDNDDDDMEARMGGKDKPNPKGDTASQADEQLRQVTRTRNETRHAPHWSRSSRPTLT